MHFQNPTWSGINSCHLLTLRSLVWLIKFSIIPQNMEWKMKVPQVRRLYLQIDVPNLKICPSYCLKLVMFYVFCIIIVVNLFMDVFLYIFLTSNYLTVRISLQKGTSSFIFQWNLVASSTEDIQRTLDKHQWCDNLNLKSRSLLHQAIAGNIHRTDRTLMYAVRRRLMKKEMLNWKTSKLPGM